MSLIDRADQPSNKTSGPKKRTPYLETPHFYLPDLCSINALLPLILVGELLAIALSVSISNLPTFNWLGFSLLSAEILWIVLIGAALLCRLRPILPRLTAQMGVALCFTALLTVIALVAIAGQWLQSYLNLNLRNNLWIVLQHTAVGAILSGLILRYFYLQQQLHLQQQAQLQASMHAQFQSLQSRIRPHFLFNSMNTIASLIDSDPETAERVVEDMSALFRASLSAAEDLVPLSQELSLCERYINIEQLRLGERLHVTWQNSIQRDDYLVPSFSLQPLIENAIYHGIQPLVGGGIINISITDQGNQLKCCIDNPFSQDTANLKRKTGNGMALDNLEQRLRAQYGGRAAFSVLKEIDKFTVAFLIPIENGAGKQGGNT